MPEMAVTVLHRPHQTNRPRPKFWTVNAILQEVKLVWDKVVAIAEEEQARGGD